MNSLNIYRSVKPIFATVVLLATSLYGATSRSDVKSLEASEDIKLISQQIAKDYFYLAQNPQKRAATVSLNTGVMLLDEKLRLIAAATKNKDTKDVLTFLAFSRDEISETIAQPYDVQNGSLMLDYSETLLEGAESIARDHSYDFSNEERMLIYVKNMAYLIERITKYYMAYQIGFNDHNNIKELNTAVKTFDDELLKISRYEYDEISAENLAVIQKFWPTAKRFYLSLEKRKLPNILYLSAEHLESAIEKLELYHSQNL